MSNQKNQAKERRQGSDKIKQSFDKAATKIQKVKPLQCSKNLPQKLEKRED